MPNTENSRKRLLEELRGLGYSVSHPLIVHEVEMRKLDY